MASESCELLLPGSDLDRQRTLKLAFNSTQISVKLLTEPRHRHDIDLPLLFSILSLSYLEMTLQPGSSASALPGTKRPVDVRTPSATPSRGPSPPPQTDRGRLEARHSLDNSNQRKQRQRRSDSTRSIQFDTDAVDNALLREIHRQQRESTPGVSPYRKRQRLNGDRCVHFENYLSLPNTSIADQYGTPQIYTHEIRPRLASQFQSPPRGRVSSHSPEAKEAHTAWRAPFSEE